ncbi:MAG: hypothetical protein IT306_13245 [Chloroflexi bacterium]|nr:hypothetical protein [Chloroflexota bacterium]
MTQPPDLARVLVEAGAATATSDGPSGLTLDVTALLSYPSRRDLVVEAVVGWLRAAAPDADLIVCPNIQSLPLATLAASALGLPMAYLRPRPKEHGRRRQVEGVLPEGARTVLLYDELTNETPVAEAQEIVEAHGGTVRRVAGLLGDATTADATLTTRAAVREGMLTARGGPVGDEPPPALPLPSEQRRHQIRERVAEILLAAGAVSINSRQPFRYASGLLSPIYTDNRLLISHPALWGEVIAGYADALAVVAARQRVDVLAGAATAGVPHAVCVAQATNYPLTFVDLGAPNEAEDRSGRAYGRLRSGDHVVMIEDLVTTGKSVFESVAALRERGASVGWCLAILAYNPAGIGEVLAAQGLGFTALSDITTLLDVGVRGGQLSEADRDAVLQWLDDPKAWSAAAEARIASA